MNLPAGKGISSVIEDTCALIAIDTSNTPGNETPAAKWLAERVGRFGMDSVITEVHPSRANCVSILKFGPGPTLLFCTHLDVVPGPADLFTPRVDSIRIYGRGACDAKGALAAMVAAVEEASRNSEKLCGSIVIAAVVDEEIGATGAIFLASSGFHADAVVIGEPTSNMVLSKSRGVLRSKVTFLGRSGHASKPQQGLNAIDAASKVITSLNQYGQHLIEQDLGTCVVTMISGGTGVNIIPDLCEIVIDRRIPFWGSVEDAERDLDELISDALFGGEISWTRTQSGTNVNALNLDPQSSFLTIIAAIPNIKFGSVFPAVTDAPHFNDRGMPSVILGPGSIDQAHVRDEWVDIAELRESIKIYGEIIQHFLQR